MNSLTCFYKHNSYECELDYKILQNNTLFTPILTHNVRKVIESEWPDSIVNETSEIEYFGLFLNQDVEVKREFVGFVGLQKETIVGCLYVFPQYRRMGFGTIIINQLEHECFVNRGIHKLWLYTTSNLFNFYKSMGWKKSLYHSWMIKWTWLDAIGVVSYTRRKR